MKIRKKSSFALWYLPHSLPAIIIQQAQKTFATLKFLLYHSASAIGNELYLDGGLITLRKNFKYYNAVFLH